MNRKKKEKLKNNKNLIINRFYKNKKRIRNSQKKLNRNKTKRKREKKRNKIKKIC